MMERKLSLCSSSSTATDNSVNPPIAHLGLGLGGLQLKLCSSCSIIHLLA
ncbi:hypothetical protein HanIR_Chr11g0554711 [Helianthus annuus]|nr:hypothetical protein HanIR_Chr11g0554711 [Helianthus annuus]